MDELATELKTKGVLKNAAVEAAFRAVDRKDFVRPEYADEAYGDYPLPIGEGQTISQPYTVVFMLDLLGPEPGETILDVGAGSGWQTALLAHIVSRNGETDEGGESDEKGLNKRSNASTSRGKVYAVERIPEICAFGQKNVAKYNFIKKGVVDFRCKDATALLPDERFDRIIAAASASKEIPTAWREHLKIGGIIVAPVGESVWRFTKKSETEWREEEFPGFAFVPLIKKQGADSKKQTTGDNKHGTNADNGVTEQRRRVIRSLVLLIGITFIAALLFAPVRVPGEGKNFVVEPGAGSRQIGEALKAGGLIRSKWIFLIYAALRGRANDLKPGQYEFRGALTIPEIVSTLVRGESNEIAITIREGWSLRDIAEYLEARGVAEHGVLFAVTGEPAKDYRNLSKRPPDFSVDFPFLKDKPLAVGLEGYLYPDTYRVFRDATPEDVTRKMLENFDRRLTPDLRAEMANAKRKTFDVITVASLIEKEVTGERDQKLVAGIIWKRLEIGMALQVDASVNYATGKAHTPTAQELAYSSPFNTYRFPGLPLGPIANPGIAAIRAAIYPEPSEYLYYLSNQDGETVFSRTLDEHNAAKARHL